MDHPNRKTIIYVDGYLCMRKTTLYSSNTYSAHKAKGLLAAISLKPF